MAAPIRPRACSTRSWAKSASPRRFPTRSSRICPIRRRCRARAGTWSTSTSGIARSRTSSIPTWSRSAVGVETSSRLQTVWQVRVLDEDAGAGTTCGSPDAEVAGWADLIAPSTGRLTTGTYEVAAVDDPCELPPTGGYRGLENQLYRVEIHDPGQPGGPAHVQVVARQRQRRQPRRQHDLGQRARARDAGPRRRAALQHRRLGGDHRRRARVRAETAARCAASPWPRPRAASRSNAPLARGPAARRLPGLRTFPRRATCACACWSQRDVVLRGGDQRRHHRVPGP